MTVSFVQKAFYQPSNKWRSFSKPVIAGQFFLQKTMSVERLNIFCVKPSFIQEVRKLAFAEAILEKWQCWTLPLVHHERAFHPAKRPEIRHGYEYSPSRLEDAVGFYKKRFRPFHAMLYHAYRQVQIVEVVRAIDSQRVALLHRQLWIGCSHQFHQFARVFDTFNVESPASQSRYPVSCAAASLQVQSLRSKIRQQDLPKFVLSQRSVFRLSIIVSRETRLPIVVPVAFVARLAIPLYTSARYITAATLPVRLISLFAQKYSIYLRCSPALSFRAQRRISRCTA